MLNNVVGLLSLPTPPEPQPLAGYYCWLDANHAPSFTYSSGTIVSKWTDRSVNALEFTQTTVANQPSRSGTQNSKTTVVFDGTNDGLISNAGAANWKFLNDGSASTIFIVVKMTTLTGTLKVVFDTSSNTAGTGNYFGAVTGTQALGVVNATSNYIEAYGTSDTNYHVWTCVNDLTNGTAANQLILYKDSGSASASPTKTGGWSIPSGNPSNPLTIGTDGTQSRPMVGQIAEMVIYKSILSGTDRNTNIDYLKNKWGI